MLLAGGRIRQLSGHALPASLRPLPSNIQMLQLSFETCDAQVLYQHHLNVWLDRRALRVIRQVGFATPERMRYHMCDSHTPPPRLTMPYIAGLVQSEDVVSGVISLPTLIRAATRFELHELGAYAVAHHDQTRRRPELFGPQRRRA